MKTNYIKEMQESGYCKEHIDDFHFGALSYLSKMYFPDKASRVLDVGAGQGHCLIPLKNEGYLNLAAIDNDDFNRNYFNKKNIKFYKVDVEKERFPLDNTSFDVVISFHLIEHLLEPDIYISEVWRVLKSRGIFILVTPDWRKQYKTFWRDHTHKHPYDGESLSRLLRCNEFKILKNSPFGVLRGLDRFGLWKFYKELIFTGVDLIAIGEKQ